MVVFCPEILRVGGRISARPGVELQEVSNAVHIGSTRLILLAIKFVTRARD
jgi:hypothetical protein